MPTRSGLDYSATGHYECAYCYGTFLDLPGITKYSGMREKRVMYRMEDDTWVALPGEWTEVWTEPHCFDCDRKVRCLPTPTTFQLSPVSWE